MFDIKGMSRINENSFLYKTIDSKTVICTADYFPETIKISKLDEKGLTVIDDSIKRGDLIIVLDLNSKKFSFILYFGKEPAVSFAVA